MKKLLSFILTILSCAGLFAACDREDSSSAPKEVDYAAAVTLDMESTETIKQVTTVKLFIDGDTTHFNVPTNVSVTGNGVLKARYLAINTPESTGKIEEWGKAASKFTRSKLESATSIVLETDGNKWELDSTGGRHLVWVWYKPEGSDSYRNLNIEILQEGLAIASDSEGNRYGETCGKALRQATALKKHVHGDEVDPDFYYGDAIPLDLKTLRLNIADYDGQKVAFEGVITHLYNSGAYLESYDDETEQWYGMYVYYGYNTNPFLGEVIVPGNKLRIVGTVSYYEAGGKYQVSGIEYNMRNPDDPNSCKLLDEENKYDPANVETTAAMFFGKKRIQLQDEDTATEYDYTALAMETSISMKDLRVVSTYTTNNGGDSDGSISITCSIGDRTITVRTDVLKDADGKLVTEDIFTIGKKIDVKGVIDYYQPDGSDTGYYQIKVFNIEDITIH